MSRSIRVFARGLASAGLAALILGASAAQAAPADPSPGYLVVVRDDTGPGTEMAGVAAARDNSIGVVGVAPGARIWAVKVGGPKGAKSSDVVCGLDWVAGHAATIHVASLSMSGAGSDDGNCGLINKD